jgi:phosphocarrier protein HPr
MAGREFTMVTKDIVICNKLGLHARAATKFANLSGRFSCALKVHYNGKSIDGKSIMSLMLLAASKGTLLSISADGDDEIEAIHALEALILDRFGEGE